MDYGDLVRAVQVICHSRFTLTPLASPEVKNKYQGFASILESVYKTRTKSARTESLQSVPILALQGGKNVNRAAGKLGPRVTLTTTATPTRTLTHLSLKPSHVAKSSFVGPMNIFVYHGNQTCSQKIQKLQGFLMEDCKLVTMYPWGGKLF